MVKLFWLVAIGAVAPPEATPSGVMRLLVKSSLLFSFFSSSSSSSSPLLLSPTATIHKRSVGQLFFFVLDPFSSVGAFVLCISFLLVVLILDFGVQVHTECHWSDPSSCRLISLLLYYIPRDTARYAKLEPAKQLGYTSFSSDLDLNMNE